MSAPVDVLGVIRTLMSVVRTDNGNLHKEINDLLEEADEAAAAVVELIEAAKRIAEYADDDYVPNVAFARLIQALAAVGGAK